MKNRCALISINTVVYTGSVLACILEHLLSRRLRKITCYSYKRAHDMQYLPFSLW